MVQVCLHENAVRTGGGLCGLLLLWDMEEETLWAMKDRKGLFTHFGQGCGEALAVTTPPFWSPAAHLLLQPLLSWSPAAHLLLQPLLLWSPPARLLLDGRSIFH